jgi:hypothetical protein
VALEAAGLALAGSTVMMAYDRSDLARHYLRQALALDRSSWRQSRFWKTSLLLLAPPIGARVMRKRMGIKSEDLAYAYSVQETLRAKSLLVDLQGDRAA